MWWALAFSAVTTLGLGILVWMILLSHALVYGVAAVISPEAVAAPEEGRYALAFAVGALANLVSAPALVSLARTGLHLKWTPVAQGLAAAVTAFVVAACALLLTLGINPVDFLAKQEPDRHPNYILAAYMASGT